jgi:phosphonate transport system substrate-binding protein
MSRALRLGAVAYHPRIVTIWERFRVYFDDAGVPTDYTLYSNYERLVEALLDGEVDIGWNTNTAYVAADERAGGHTRILGMRDVDRTWATVLAVRRGRAVPSLADLADRTVALGSRDSGHAAILPLRYLSVAGVVPNRDCKLVRFDTDVGKHGDTGNSEVQVVRAVASGEADAGFISEAYFSAFRAQGLPEMADLEIAWRSPTYYHCNFTSLESLDEAVTRAWTQALLAMDYDDASLRPAMELEGVRRWYEGDDDGYASLRAAMREQATTE